MLENFDIIIIRIWPDEPLQGITISLFLTVRCLYNHITPPMKDSLFLQQVVAKTDVSGWAKVLIHTLCKLCIKCSCTSDWWARQIDDIDCQIISWWKEESCMLWIHHLENDTLAAIMGDSIKQSQFYFPTIIFKKTTSVIQSIYSSAEPTAE